MKALRILAIVFIIFALFMSFSQKGRKIDNEALVKEIKNIRVPFVKNYNQYEKEVSYYAKTFGGSLFITKDGVLVYDLPKVEKKEKENAKDKAFAKREEHKVKGGVVIRESLIGARIKEVKGEEKSETKVSYFIGNDPKKWKSGIETYNRVSLGEVI